jgi:hypothetical protein
VNKNTIENESESESENRNYFQKICDPTFILKIYFILRLLSLLKPGNNTSGGPFAAPKV